jgi:hypothetical protein
MSFFMVILHRDEIWFLIRPRGDMRASVVTERTKDKGKTLVVNARGA